MIGAAWPGQYEQAGQERHNPEGQHPAPEPANVGEKVGGSVRNSLSIAASFSGR
jgi:hypothetical protein